MKNPISPGWGLLRALGTACLFSVALAATSSAQDPVLWINFDDGSANDLSGNGLNGELMGGAEIVEDPERGMVLSLDGSDGHVPINDPDGLLDFSDGRSATVAAWVYHSSKTHNQVFAQGEWNDGAGLALKGDTDPVDQIWTQGQGGGTAQRSDVGVPENEWHHVAATFAYDPDADELQVSFYLNGELTGYAEGGDPLEGGINAPAGGGNTIGREQRGDADTARWFFDGMIDDLQVYEAALDQSGIQLAMAGLSLEVAAPITANFGSVRFVQTLDRLTEGAWSNPEAINEGDEVYLGEDDTVTSLPAELAGKLAFRPENEVIVTDPLNFGFEEPILGATSGETFTNLWDGDADAAEFLGWTYTFEAGQPGSPSAGVQNPAEGFYGSANPLPEPFEGNQIGFINLNNEGETVALADSNLIGELEAGQTYTLNIAVGGRATDWSDIEYSIGLVAADGTELGEFSSVVVEPRSENTENMVDMTYTLDVNAEAAGFAGDDFFIRLRSANVGGEIGGFTQANFDNVRLDPAPETESEIEITAAGPLGFVVDRDTTVSIAVDENMAVPAWISNRYNDTGTTIATTTGNFDVWARDFDARDIVALQGSERADMDENNHWVILSHGPEAITVSGDNLFSRSAIDSNDWRRGNFHWTLATDAASELHEAAMLAEIGNVNPEAGMGLSSNIRVPRLQDAGDNAFGFVLLRNPDDPSSSLQAEWLPRAAGGDSTLRLVDVSTGNVLDEVTWNGLVPTAVDNDVGVSAGADETVIAVGDPTFPDEVSVPLDEDFEDGAPGWTSGSFNSTADQWEIGVPASGPGEAVSGENVAATNLDGGYEAESASWLRTPVVDLTDAVDATLTFQEYSDVDTFVDAVGNLFHFVSVSVLDADTLEQEAELARYSENILDWQERELDLSAFAGSEIVIEFAFFSDDEMSEAGDGWYIDDVLVTAGGTRIAGLPAAVAHGGTLNGIATDNAGVGDDSDSHLQFTVADRGSEGNDGVTVYVAWDTLASGLEPDWLRDDFTQTDHFVDLTVGEHRLWAREYSGGDQVTLGGASAAGAGPFAEGTNNYFVLFGDARPGLETSYSLASEAVFENGAWDIDFSLTDANGHTQSVSARFEITLAEVKQFGVFARHPDSDAGAVTHAPIMEVDDLSIEFLEDIAEATRLAFEEQPSNGVVDQTLPPVTIRLEDDAGTLAEAATNEVTLALGDVPEPDPGFFVFDDFQGYSADASIDGQGGWEVTGGAGTVVTDPFGESENQVLEITEGGPRVWNNTIPSLPEAGEGTLYFRFATSDFTVADEEQRADWLLGLSPESSFSPSPGFDDVWPSVRPVGNTGDAADGGDLTVRNGDSFDSAGSFSIETWYEVWVLTTHEGLGPNFGFETPMVDATSGEVWDDSMWDDDAEEAVLDGWTMYFEAGQPGSPSVGVQNPAEAHYGAVNPLPDPFEGNQIGFMNLNNEGETVGLADSDIVGELEAGEAYELNIAVGGRATDWSDIEYSIGLVAADGTELGEFATVVVQPRGDNTGNIVDMSYTLDVDAEASDFVGEEFFIRLRAANVGGEIGGFTQANFDNVRLEGKEPNYSVYVRGGPEWSDQTELASDLLYRTTPDTPAELVSLVIMGGGGHQGPVYVDDVALDPTGHNLGLPEAAPEVPALNGTLTVAAESGLATFSDLSVSTEGTFTLTASSPDLESDTSASFTISLPGDIETFEDWTARHGLSGEDAEATASPAGDGVTNLMKYALDLDPLESALRSDLPRLEQDEEGNLVLTYTERTDVEGIEYIPQLSEDLVTWESGEPQVVEFLRESGDEAHLEDVSVRGQPSENAMKAFLRLTVRLSE